MLTPLSRLRVSVCIPSPLSRFPFQTERNKAMDLLEALSRSGTLPLTDAQLHVFLCATHCFDKSLLETVIQDNVNPIDRVERSALIMAATLHDVPVLSLVKASHESRVRDHSPGLLE